MNDVIILEAAGSALSEGDGFSAICMIRLLASFTIQSRNMMSEVVMKHELAHSSQRNFHGVETSDSDWLERTESADNPQQDPSPSNQV